MFRYRVRVRVRIRVSIKVRFRVIVRKGFIRTKKETRELTREKKNRTVRVRFNMIQV